jgi:hypothetical protein
MTEVIRDEKTRPILQRQASIFAAALMSLSACTSIIKYEAEPNVQRQLLAFKTTPAFISTRPGEIDATIEALGRFAARAPLRGDQTRKTSPSQVALLHGSSDGRAYLSVAGPRAFVIGAPPAQCPARVAAAGGDAPADAIGAALRGCFAALKAARAPETCGCKVMAMGAALLAPLPEFAYAPGVSGWIVAPALGLDLHLAVREGVSPDGVRRLDFLTGPGADIRAALARDGTAMLIVRRDGEAPLELIGVHRPEGLRRGRFADRLRVTDAEGREAVALIGFEPVEYALRRKELLRWR